jgi:hypothetical protein
MTSWHSYPSLYNIGHKALGNLFVGPVVVQEKVDGSQFSFGSFEGELRCRSKGAQLDMEHPQDMFKLGVAAVRGLADSLRDGHTYRGEFLAKPKHNTLAYSREPILNIILYDIQTEEETYLSPEEVQREAKRLGLEVVPTFAQGDLSPSPEDFTKWLDNISCLGGPKIEGVVIKNYTQFGPDKKALLGKFVSTEFKEVHTKDWKERNPGQSDIVQMLGMEYRTPARWEKAIQHLRDAGKLEDTPRDIGLLLKEVQVDILKECEEEIQAKLWKWIWPKLSREIVSGLPEFYKKYLFERQIK